MATANRTAIMCAEAVWWRCHRRLLADVLLLRGWSVRQVMPDGRLVVHELSPIARRGEDGLSIYPAAADQGGCGLNHRARMRRAGRVTRLRP